MGQGSALGAKLEYAEFVDADTPVTYAELMECGDYAYPYGTSERLRTTTHESLKEKYTPGIVDPGVMSVPIMWDDDDESHQWVEEHIHEKHQFKYTPKDGTPVEFLAILKSLTVDNPVGTAAKQRTLVLRLSGGAVADEA